MKTYTLPLVFIVLSTLCHYSDAMDKPAIYTNTPQNEITQLNNGLLTEISAVICHTKCGFLTQRYIKNTKIETDTLVNLIHKKGVNFKDNNVAPMDLFCPLLYRENDGCFAYVGPFDRKSHYEALEAMRQNKALYYAIGRGAIIYSIKQQPSITICSDLKEKLEKSILDFNTIERA